MYLIDDFPRVCVFAQQKSPTNKPAEQPYDFLDKVPVVHTLEKVARAYSTIVVRAEEVALLERECLLLSSLTSAPEALAGLRKLLSMARSAEQHKLGILITSP